MIEKNLNKDEIKLQSNNLKIQTSELIKIVKTFNNLPADTPLPDFNPEKYKGIPLNKITEMGENKVFEKFKTSKNNKLMKKIIEKAEEAVTTAEKIEALLIIKEK